MYLFGLRDKCDLLGLVRKIFIEVFIQRIVI